MTGPPAPGERRASRRPPARPAGRAARRTLTETGGDRAQHLVIAALWAVVLGRFRDYMQLRKDTDMPLDTSELSRAYAEFDGVARSGDFGPPSPGEWDAEHTLAHVVSGDASIASAVLAVVAGQRPVYDNRVNQDESNLQWIIKQAGGLAGLADLVRRNGELLCLAAAQLSDEQLNQLLPVLIVSDDEVVVDEPRPLRSLIEGIGRAHLPMHGQQLRSLKLSDPT
jgi:hypothetical protein